MSLAAGETPSQMTFEFKWLALLFLQTVLLLAFQVTAGLLSGSLALLADSGHGVADVIGYAINLLSERQKIFASSPGRDQWSLDFSADSIDLLGSGISTVLLCVVTWFAIMEAIERLQEGHPNRSQDPGAVSAPAPEFGAVGPALLSFALISTLANLGTLLLYTHWRRQDDQPNAELKDPGFELVPVPPVPVAARGPTLPKSAAVPLPPLPVVASVAAGPGQQVMEPPGPYEMSPLVSESGRSRRGRKIRGPTFCKPYTPVASCASSPSPQALEAGIPSCRDAACADAACVAKGHSPDCGGCASGSSDWTSFIHRIVHPGCTENHHTGYSSASPGTGSEADTSTDAGKTANLNVTSAMLHLAADVLRGITILVVALVIQFGKVPDPGKADAICALAVAAFVALGSAEMVRRLALALWQRRPWRERPGEGSEQEQPVAMLPGSWSMAGL